VAEIARRTGESKGNISSYLNGKKPIPENFFKTLSEGFKGQEAAEEGHIELRMPDTHRVRVDELQETKEDLRAARKVIDSHVEYLQDLLKSSLGKLIDGQSGGLAILLEILDRDVRREANGNTEREKEIRAEIARRIGPKLNADLKADIGADARR